MSPPDSMWTGHSYGGDGNRSFGLNLLGAQLMFFVLYCLFVDYQDANPDGDAEEYAAAIEKVNWYYPMYQDVHVMIFIGFGFLMTFLAKYAWSSVSYNMMVSCVAIQWSVLVVNFWHMALEKQDVVDSSGYKRFHEIKLGVDSLILGDFAAGTVLISFGALLGRVTPTQLVWLALMEIIVYALNEGICVIYYEAVDMGGSMYVHTFGAYFGLAASAGLALANGRGGKATGDDKKQEALNTARYDSDLFAMIGTIFLWMFWPSFNGALAPNEGFAKERVVLNTVISLCASCLMAFAFSRMFDPSHKFNMVHIQNATLAGGVAVGSSSDLVIGPYGSMLIGMIAGIISVMGYIYVSPWIQRQFGIKDTCGVNNLHGMPGLLGGLGGVISAASAGDKAYGSSIGVAFPAREDGRSAGSQAAYQLAALGTTLAMAVIGGFMVGYILGMDCLFAQEKHRYSDESHWLLEEEEEEDEVEMQHKKERKPMVL